MRPGLPLLAPTVVSFLALGACNGSGSSGKGPGEACASAGECRSDLVCFERTCAASYPPSPTCAPPGSPVIVRGDPIVAPEPPPGACVTTIRDPVMPPADVQDLGEHAVGDQIPFTIPDGTSSFSIVSQEVADTAVPGIVFQGFALPNTVVPTDIRDPANALFFSDTDPYPKKGAYDDVTGLLAYYGGATPVSGSFTVPNTAAGLDLVRTAGEVPPGPWTLTVNDWAQECISVAGCSGGDTGGVYRLHVFTRPGRFASTGTLDLEVYLATDPAGRLPSAAVAAGDPTAAPPIPPDPQIQRWVQDLSTIFARAGICLGTVTFRDLPDWAKSRYAPDGIVDISGAGASPGCDDLAQLFTVGVAQSRAVHLFLAEELTDPTSPGPGTILGIDGSIPGPSGVPGTINGGAVVGLFGFFGAEAQAGACSGANAGPPYACGTDILAYVAAHETGHWLGLYHPTEALGVTFDPLTDTARCACLSCMPYPERLECAERGADSPVAVFPERCTGRTRGCGGGRNLMFWAFDRALSTGELTRQQGDVMRLNPAVQ